MKIVIKQFGDKSLAFEKATCKTKITVVDTVELALMLKSVNGQREKS